MLILAALFNIAAIERQPGAPAAAAPAAKLQPYLLAMTVPDADAAAAWYVDKLGFQLGQRSDFPDYGLRIVFLERDGFRLELVQNRESFGVAKHVQGYDPASGLLQGMSKFAFRVKDAAALAADVESKGVKIAYPLRTDLDTRRRHFTIQDLNGNLIQFVQLLD